MVVKYFLLEEGFNITEVSVTSDLGDGKTIGTIGGFFVQDDGKFMIDFKKIVQLQNYYLMVQMQVQKMLDNNSQQKTGDSLVLDGSDASTDVREKVLFEDETGSGDILLDGTDSSSTDLVTILSMKRELILVIRT